MSLPRGNFSACSVSDHELLAIGGYSNDDECTGECEILDLRTTRWRPTGPLAQPRAFGAAVGSGQVRGLRCHHLYPCRPSHEAGGLPHTSPAESVAGMMLCAL